MGVLHYDHDYDRIAEHGGLDFASVWVGPRNWLERQRLIGALCG
jgi:hypothetical protein